MSTYNIALEIQHSLEYLQNLNMGTFNYPILMAADIIGYYVDAVPVGKDQLQDQMCVGWINPVGLDKETCLRHVDRKSQVGGLLGTEPNFDPLGSPGPLLLFHRYRRGATTAPGASGLSQPWASTAVTRYVTDPAPSSPVSR